jgi:hypothetical protein
MSSISAPRAANVFGQFPQLKTYNHGIISFPLDDGTPWETVVEALETAAARVVAKIPWLGDQVVHEGKDSGGSGTFTLAPWPSDASPNTLVRARDCTDICPSFGEMVAANGPVVMFDGQVLCPFPAFPLSYDEAVIGPAPVVQVQANRVRGGVLLNFSNQHNMVDATGLLVFIMLLAAAMRGEDLPDKIVQAANLDHSAVIPLLEEGESGRDYSHLYRPVAPPQGAGPQQTRPAMPPTRWAYFRFSKQSVAAIKARASEGPADPRVPFISSNDALCAFYWQRLSTVRLAQGGVDATASSKCSRAIDARGAIGVPMGYLGQMVLQVATRLPLGEVASQPLAALAGLLRRDLNETNTAHAVRSYASFLARTPDRSVLLYGGAFDPRTDVGTSSMAGASVPPHFGSVLGTPAFIRRPNLPPVPCCLYFYPPEGPHGHTPVLACLAQREMEALRADPEWSAAAEYIG